ncbi:hypothetical protein [Streptomyces sp. H27-D2]|uniref:hypothetical protein n=1 Tax=Streptomyces sp. H27-D2 TaxID=3046304 RepID=UPI002DBEA175|nr:hypothetical protein [Streptomyces sp. H27-D2]MEC4020459.1 hypothetical protein [Streptomyces sp. H27-D2]
MSERHEDQEHAVEPARPTLTVAQAQEVTAGLREAVDDVWRTVAVARRPGVVPLGPSSREAYCDAEFGISRA